MVIALIKSVAAYKANDFIRGTSNMHVGTKEWMGQFQKMVNNDQELNVIGKYFTTKFLWQIGPESYVIEVLEGKVKNIISNPTPLEPWKFAIRGTVDAWRKFTQPTPPPMYHELFAAMFQGNLQIDGDIKELMANLRAMTRLLDVTREVQLTVA